MSNLLKKAVIVDKDEKVIDYNELIKNKLEAFSRKRVNGVPDEDGFINGLTAQVVEEIDNDEESSMTMEQLEAHMEDVQRQAEQIIAQANEEAAAIIEQAHNEAANIKEQAKKQGHDEGIISVTEEFERKKNELEQNYELLKQQLYEETENIRSNMEPQLVDVMTDVFGRVIYTAAEDNKDIIIHLINGVLEGSDISHEFLIKVSEQDYQYVADNQGKLYCAMTKDVNIDVIEDKSMKMGECVVETDSGVFNCSIDVELKNLIKRIKLLSCM